MCDYKNSNEIYEGILFFENLDTLALQKIKTKGLNDVKDLFGIDLMIYKLSNLYFDDK